MDSLVVLREVKKQRAALTLRDFDPTATLGAGDEP
jgi:hypothetical protein